MLIGLLSGQIGASLHELSRLTPKNRPLRWSVLLFWPLGFFTILIVGSRAFAFGYYSGLGITFCFGFALIALVRKHFETTKKASER